MRFKMSSLVVASALMMAGTGLVAQVAGDADAGKKIFKKCAACHQIGDKAKNRSGPVLNNVFGRQAGTFESYKYGKDLKAAGVAGLVWDAAQMEQYLVNPKQFIRDYLDNSSAKVKMSLKLKKEADRLNVIAYLQQFSEMAEPAEAGTDG